MKSLLRGALLCLGLLSASSQAQMIYKCVVNGAIAYQEEPCAMQAQGKGVSSNTALVGTWVYDHDTTMAWSSRHDKPSKLDAAELDALADHITLTFTQNTVSRDLKAFDVKVDGNVQKHVEAKQDSTVYNVVSANAKVVTISMQSLESISAGTVEYHFEGPDSMWFSLANQRLTAVDNPNARAYYKRVH